WSAVLSDQHTGLYSAYAPDVASVSDQRLTLNGPIAVPLNATQASLTFWHRFNLEAAGQNAYDGGVLEISTDGTSWADPSFIAGGYNRTVLACPSQNPLAGRAAWSGDSLGWQQVTANLLAY